MRRLLDLIRGFWASRQGAIAMMTALIAPVILVGLGSATDYIAATRREAKLNGIADAAALSAASRQMLNIACPNGLNNLDCPPYAAAWAVINAQGPTVTGLTPGSLSWAVNIADVGTPQAPQRTVQVSYTSASANIFAQVIGVPSLGLRGGATAQSTIAPDINFYLLIDTSPSMELPATQTAINYMVNSTSDSCAFACHQSSSSGLSGLPYCADFPNGGEDSYTWAEDANCPRTVVNPDGSKGSTVAALPLRIDNVRNAVSDLLTQAPIVAQSQNTTYNMAIYGMDYQVHTIQALTPLNSQTASTIQGVANSGIIPLVVCKNNYRACNTYDQDTDSYLDAALLQMYANNPSGTGVPAGGIGTATSPKSVLMIVSDALPDWRHGASSSRFPFIPIGTLTDSKGNSYCTELKNNNVVIAFLYLVYYPISTPNGNFYQINDGGTAPDNATGSVGALQGCTSTITCNQNQTPYNSANDQIYQAAQACASPGLFAAVTVNGDIAGTLKRLFLEATESAYLSK